MRAFEFKSSLSPDGTLPVPQNVAEQLGKDQPVRVIVLIPEADEEPEWAQLTRDQFLKGYAESDAIYDEL